MAIHYGDCDLEYDSQTTDHIGKKNNVDCVVDEEDDVVTEEDNVVEENQQSTRPERRIEYSSFVDEPLYEGRTLP